MAGKNAGKRQRASTGDSNDAAPATKSNDAAPATKSNDANQAGPIQTTKRGGRSKRMAVPNPIAQARGTLSAIKKGKKVSNHKILKETVIPLDDRNDKEHEKVVFIDDNSKEPVLALYRKTEGAEPMATLWADFLESTHSIRAAVGADVTGTFLNQNEAAAIDLRNNAELFPTLITKRGHLRAKDNANAASSAGRKGGMFTKKTDADEEEEEVTANAQKAKDLKHRANALRIKAHALEKQASAYEAAARCLENDEDVDVDTESSMAKAGMLYIGDAIPLKRIELNKYIQAHEEHLTATVERLRIEFSPLAAYVSKAEKRLRDLVQLKVAADLKLCRDIKKFGRFEVQAWQMGALPTERHICRCLKCTMEPHDKSYGTSKLRYPDFEIAAITAEDALPQVKLEDDDDDEQYFSVQGSATTTVASAINTPKTSAPKAKRPKPSPPTATTQEAEASSSTAPAVDTTLLEASSARSRSATLLHDGNEISSSAPVNQPQQENNVEDNGPVTATVRGEEMEDLPVEPEELNPEDDVSVHGIPRR